MTVNRFIDALQTESVDSLNKIPKGDRHNHISRGGNVNDYRVLFNIPEIERPAKFDGYIGMERWYRNNIRKYFDNSDYLVRIRLALQHLSSSGIKKASESRNSFSTGYSSVPL